MGLTSSLAIFFIIWWLVLFAVLPFGVRTQEEDGEVAPGTVPSAPARPLLVRKALITTLIAAILFAAFYVAQERGWIDLYGLGAQQGRR